MPTPIINLLQVEAVRKGTKAYKPRSPKSFIDLTSSASQTFLPDISDHATAVAQLWQDHGGSALVANYYVCEQGNFEVNILRAGKTFPALSSPPVHIAIFPCGENWEGVSNYAVQKLQLWAASVGALVLKSPPDAGQGFYQSPCQAVGDNILNVASSTTGSEMSAQPPVDLYFPVDWNSYAQPSMLSAGGILVLLDWLFQNKISYAVKDLKALLIASASKDSHGRPTLNGGAALAMAKAKYAAAPIPIPAPPAPPVVITPPAPTPTPTPVPPTPVVTPPPVTTPTGQTGTGSKPVILKFNHGVSSAWSGPGANATTFSFAATGADTLTLVDPKGIKKDVTGKTSCIATGVYIASNTWTLIAENKFGSASLTEVAVHGCFSPADLASL
jgi:hypothetical protein